eukprot:799-Heterococcus_DN1.PRE.1
MVYSMRNNGEEQQSNVAVPTPIFQRTYVASHQISQSSIMISRFRVLNKHVFTVQYCPVHCCSFQQLCEQKMQLFLFYLYLAVVDPVVEGLQFTACGSDIVWTSDQVFQQHNIISTAAGARTFLKQFGFAPRDGARADAASAKQWHHPLFSAQQRDLRQLFLTPGGYFSFSSAPSSPQPSSPRRKRSVRAVTSVQPVPLATLTPAFASDAAANREVLSVDEALQWCETFGRSASSVQQRKPGRTARAVKRVRVLSRSASKRLRDKCACSNSKSAISANSNSNCNSSSSSRRRRSRMAGVTNRAVKRLTTLSSSVRMRLNDARISSSSSDSISSTGTTSTGDSSSSNNNIDSSSARSHDVKCSCLVQ